MLFDNIKKLVLKTKFKTFPEPTFWAKFCASLHTDNFRDYWFRKLRLIEPITSYRKL